jgi:hypothetical protein
MTSLRLLTLSSVLGAVACSGAVPPPPEHPLKQDPLPQTVTMSPALLDRSDEPARVQPPPPPPPPPGASQEEQDTVAIRAKIVEGVSEHFPEFRACYDSGTNRHPGLAGRVAVRFLVAPSGEVVAVDDDGSTMPDLDTIECVKAVFTRMRFLEWSGKAISVAYPIEFSMTK